MSSYNNKKVVKKITIKEVDKVEKLIIPKKSLKGEDGYKVFSIRIKDETVEALEKIVADSNRSRNEIINILLDFAIKHAEIK